MLGHWDFFISFYRRLLDTTDARPYKYMHILNKFVTRFSRQEDCVWVELPSDAGSLSGDVREEQDIATQTCDAV